MNKFPSLVESKGSHFLYRSMLLPRMFKNSNNIGSAGIKQVVRGAYFGLGIMTSDWDRVTLEWDDKEVLRGEGSGSG